MCWFLHNYFVSRVIDMGDVKLTRLVDDMGLMFKNTRGFSVQKSCRHCGRSVFNTKYEHEFTRAELAEVVFRLEAQQRLANAQELPRHCSEGSLDTGEDDDALLL